MSCSGIFDHSMDKMETVDVGSGRIVKRCPKCNYEESLPLSKRATYFVNNLVVQTKKWAADDNAKELLQPWDKDGNPNPEFTEAYGYNPLDERTKHKTPELLGGTA